MPHAETVPSHLRSIFRRIIAAGLLAGSTAFAAPTSAIAEPTAIATPAGASQWNWPIAAPRIIARGFIAPATLYTSGHRGIDLWLDDGSPVFAPESGVVHFVGVVVNRPVISLEHPGGLISSFEPVASTLAIGAPVHRGEQIGILQPAQAGAPQSGHCGAPCLHLGARLHGQYVSPLNFLGGIPHSVLLPTRKVR